MAYSESSWRNRAAPIIAKALNDTKGEPERKIRQALFDAYPFGQRQHWPYAIWLDEIKRQRKLKPKLGTFGPKARAVAKVADERQERLFPEAANR